MKNPYYYILARSKTYGEGFVHLDADGAAVIRGTPEMFTTRGAADLVAEQFEERFGGVCLVREVRLK